MQWLFRKSAERDERSPRIEIEPSDVQATADQTIHVDTIQVGTVQVGTVQVSSIRETINLLESDLGAMIGDVQRACEFVCREAEDSATASDQITQRSDTLVAQAGNASHDLTQLAAAIEQLGAFLRRHRLPSAHSG